MLSFAYGWFDWPQGAVLTNLVASGICVALGVWKLLGAHKKLHVRLDAHEEKLDLIHQHFDIHPGAKEPERDEDRSLPDRPKLG